MMPDAFASSVSFELQYDEEVVAARRRREAYGEKEKIDLKQRYPLVSMNHLQEADRKKGSSYLPNRFIVL